MGTHGLRTTSSAGRAGPTWAVGLEVKRAPRARAMVIEGGSPQAKNPQKKFRYGISSGDQIFFIRRAYNNRTAHSSTLQETGKKRVLKFAFSVAQYQDFCNSGRRRFRDGQKRVFYFFQCRDFLVLEMILVLEKKWKIPRFGDGQKRVFYFFQYRDFLVLEMFLVLEKNEKSKKTIFWILTFFILRFLLPWCH